MTRRLLRYFFVPYAMLFLAGVAATGWLTSGRLESAAAERFYDDLTVRAELIRDALAPRIGIDDAAALQVACARLEQIAQARVTLFLPSGEVLCDSQHPATSAAAALDPPRSPAVLGRSRTLPATLASQRHVPLGHAVSADGGLLHLALPVMRDDREVAVLRASISTQALAASRAMVRWQVGFGSLIVGLVGTGAGFALLRRVQLPLDTLRHGAERFAHGDLSHKLDLPPTLELSSLALALNQMAQLLEDRIGHIARQGHEQDAVLASMVEGVLAVDTEERVISLNQAGGELLSCDPALARGRGLQEIIRNADLRRFVARSLACQEAIEDDVILRSDNERVLQARGCSLRDVQGHSVGAVIVLNDVTHLRRLENLRRDFVANVSHELKTPITSIKGFVETLLDGALHQPQDAERFLKIVARQADRLNSIIEDLLSLAKIEQSVDAADVALEEAHLAEVLQAAIDECGPKALERKVSLRLACPAELRARINAPLIEQALLNLLDNAIKYSDAGGEVEVAAIAQSNAVVIAVRDQGCGIAAEHLDRLFERFYRVDKARSRKLGGTGLGLSIVKHIVHVHGGRVTVESSPGKGSTFSIVLPATPSS